jgi:hypothetical protein
MDPRPRYTKRGSASREQAQSARSDVVKGAMVFCRETEDVGEAGANAAFVGDELFIGSRFVQKKKIDQRWLGCDEIPQSEIQNTPPGCADVLG